jgi:hypothetical protein
VLQVDTGDQPMTVDFRQHGDVLHADIRQVRMKNGYDPNATRAAKRLNIVLADLGGFVQSDGKRLPHRVVVDQNPVVLQDGTCRPQGFVSLQRNHQIRLPGRNEW